MAITLSRYLKRQLLGDASITDGSMLDCFTNFTLILLDGAQPATPETSTTANTLLSITGCDFKNAAYISTVGNVILQKETAAWSNLAAASGTATWFRCYLPASGDSGKSADMAYLYSRFDGSVNNTTGDIVLSDTYIISGESKTIDQFNLQIF